MRFQRQSGVAVGALLHSRRYGMIAIAMPGVFDTVRRESRCLARGRAFKAASARDQLFHRARTFTSDEGQIPGQDQLDPTTLIRVKSNPAP